MDEVGYWQRQARRRITRRRALSVGAMGAGGAALAAVGCGDDDDDDDGGDSTAAAGGAQRDASQLPSELANARYGGTFILVINDPPIGFDFHATEQPGSQIGAFGVYNGLFRRPEDPPGNFLGLQPELVEDYEQPDETTLVMKFHEGVKWQDVAPVSGRPFTSEDVKYNLERMRGEHPAANQVAGEFRMRDLFQPVESMEASDDRTLTLKTAFPFAPLLDHLSFSWVQ
ncbi:MAG TPA: ABC transporter substrate-binding protein, partial [Dehalococcoidia bacterium]|nr:ABC transporter substrate-binding protein [Dehalococcoidia bacterium]